MVNVRRMTVIEEYIFAMERKSRRVSRQFNLLKISNLQLKHRRNDAHRQCNHSFAYNLSLRHVVLQGVLNMVSVYMQKLKEHIEHMGFLRFREAMMILLHGPESPRDMSVDSNNVYDDDEDDNEDEDDFVEDNEDDEDDADDNDEDYNDDSEYGVDVEDYDVGDGEGDYDDAEYGVDDEDEDHEVVDNDDNNDNDDDIEDDEEDENDDDEHDDNDDEHEDNDDDHEDNDDAHEYDQYVDAEVENDDDVYDPRRRIFFVSDNFLRM